MSKFADEEKSFLNEVADKVQSLIEKIANKRGVDLAYFEFELRVNILDNNFKKVDEQVLIATNKNFCDFCRAETYYYDRDTDMFLCAGCYKKLKQDRG